VMSSLIARTSPKGNASTAGLMKKTAPGMTGLNALVNKIGYKIKLSL
jgi:hypothetical protein